MITLLTASPGCGKSALAVKMIQDAIDQGRPVIQTGITDLVLPHDPAPPMSDWTEERPSPDDPSVILNYYRFPKNAFVVLDECQRFFRVRNSASKVPPHVEALETHRHTGIDILLITQHPGLIDTNARKLVGRHIHLRNSFMGRKWYEWEQVCDDPHANFKRAPVQQGFKLPKSVFSLYSSAVLHTKPKFSTPPFFKFIAYAVPIMVALGYFAYSRWDSKVHKTDNATISAMQTASPGQVGTIHTEVAQATSGISLVSDLQPQHPAHPESAPIYAELRKAVVMPQIVGCIEVKQGPCTCYTQQSTKVEMPDSMCRDMLHSPPFNPYYVKADKPKDTIPPTDKAEEKQPRIYGPTSEPSDVSLADPFRRGIKPTAPTVQPVSNS